MPSRLPQPRSGSSLVQLAEAPLSNNAIVCIPQAGAGAAVFVPLARALAGTASIWAARFPGREGRLSEPLLTSIEDMAASLAGAVSDIDAANIVFFGHCSGAYVAYELVHLLLGGDCSWPNAWLAVSAQVPPPADSCHEQPPHAGSARPELVDLLREMGGTPEGLFKYPELLELLAPAIEADFRAAERYRVADHRDRIPIPIAVLGGKDDQFLQSTQLQGWRNRTAGSFTMEFVAGGHFFLTEQVQAVGKFLLGLCEGDAGRAVE